MTKINQDDDHNGHAFISMNSTHVEPRIEPDNIWDYLKLLGFDDVTSIVDDIDMGEDNVSESEEENDDNDDDHSFLSDMEENDILLETPPFSDDDDNDEDIYHTSPLLPILVHTPDVSDEE